MTLHIGIVGPIATADVRHLLDDPPSALPRGYEGAPLLATLIAELLRQGHRVSAFTLSSDLPLRRDASTLLRGPRFELHVVPMRPRAWPFNGWRPGRIVDLYAFERGGLERAIAAARPEVVHAHWSYEFAWAALRSGLPHVVTCHDSAVVVARFQRDFRHGAYRWLRAGIAWHVLRKARHVTTVSPYMREQIQPLCQTEVSLIPNPLPVGLDRDTPARSGVIRDVVMVANGLDERKNAKTAMRAFSIWAAERPDATLHLYGLGFEATGPAHAWWHAQGLLGRVLFHGPVPQARVLMAFSECDLMLHTALEESFGMVIAEAMAMGLPVIAGRSSGAVSWIVGRDGVLVDVTDPQAVAFALSSLAQDPPAVRALGQRGRRSALQRFGSDVVTTAYLRSYSEALSSPPAALGRVAA